MAKATLKTSETKSSISDFLASVKDEEKRKDSIAIVKMMEKATGQKGKMWGSTIVGFGNTVLKYDSGRVLDWFLMGFSPRKQNLTLYGLGIQSQVNLLKKLGKFKTGKGCLYINNLADVDAKVLESLMNSAAKKTSSK
jgi:hypothetical protein